MKKIAMIIPSLLLASCLFSCEKGRDPFVIESEEKFNEAISFKEVNYLQAARLIVNYTELYLSNMYAETQMSPKIYYEYGRYTVDTPSNPTLSYVEKILNEGTKEYEYKKYTPPESGTE